MLEDFTHDINGKLLQFDGDTSLKPCKAILPWTKEHIEEWQKCRDDLLYFIENYFYLINLDKGLIIPTLRDYQKDLLITYRDELRVVTLASRQAAKTSTTVAFILHYILFNQGKNVGILANVHPMAIEIMANLKLAFSMLPKFLQQGVKTWNEKTVKLENKVNIYASATNKNSCRGKSISLLVCDEISSVSHTCWKGFSSSIFPSISSSKTAKIFITSTPLGKNQFYKIWSEANSKTNWNGYKPIRIDWWQVPGRDEKWKEQSLKDLGGDNRVWQQEYGNSFDESGFTLVDGKILSTLISSPPITYELNIPEDFKKYLKIYELPKENHIYVLGLDSAEMTTDSVGDAIALQILDVTNIPIVQVGTLHITESISYLNVPKPLKKIAKYYNEAMIIVESNSTGQEIANKLVDELEYENVYHQKITLPGFKTTKKTKRIGCSNLKYVMENNKLILNDADTIEQLNTFIKKNNTYKADGGFYDDCVMALLASLFFLQDLSQFEGLENFDITSSETSKEESLQVEETPLPQFYDGEDEVIETNDWSWLLN